MSDQRTPANAEPEEPRHRVLRGEQGRRLIRVFDPTRSGVHDDEVPSVVDRDGAVAEVVRPVDVEAATQWDAALWHPVAR